MRPLASECSECAVFCTSVFPLIDPAAFRTTIEASTKAFAVIELELEASGIMWIGSFGAASASFLSN